MTSTTCIGILRYKTGVKMFDTVDEHPFRICEVRWLPIKLYVKAEVQTICDCLVYTTFVVVNEIEIKNWLF